jgi:metal-responsive CopG/Arc/MetJ family transcriptional regulator
MHYQGVIMGAVRMTITLPEDLALELDTLVSRRKKSRFIAQSLMEKITALKKEGLQKELEEGYKPRREESRGILRDYEAADLENWDAY